MESGELCAHTLATIVPLVVFLQHTGLLASCRRLVTVLCARFAPSYFEKNFVDGYVDSLVEELFNVIATRTLHVPRIVCEATVAQWLISGLRPLVTAAQRVWTERERSMDEKARLVRWLRDKDNCMRGSRSWFEDACYRNDYDLVEEVVKLCDVDLLEIEAAARGRGPFYAAQRERNVTKVMLRLDCELLIVGAKESDFPIY